MRIWKRIFTVSQALRNQRAEGYVVLTGQCVEGYVVLTGQRAEGYLVGLVLGFYFDLCFWSVNERMCTC